MSHSPPALTSGRDLALKLLDSALLIAAILAALDFAGWTYRQAYYGRFAIDPSSLGSSNITVAVEGIGAVFTITGMWLKAILPILIGSLIVVIAVQVIDRRRAVKQSSPLSTKTLFAIRIGLSVIGVMLIIFAGYVAGTIRAKDQLDNVAHDQVWTYHLDRDTILGVTLAQTNDTTWLLTKAGVRPIKTADIRLIDGPLFKRVAHDH